MAATPAPEQQADSAEAVLAAVQAERTAADRAEVRILELALDWAAMHELDSSSLFEFERPILLGGPGTPEASEYCVCEFAAALHISTESGRCLIADALELAHRLPRVWARVTAGDLPPYGPAGSPARRSACHRRARTTSTGTSPASRTRSASPSSTGWSRRRWSGSTPRRPSSGGSNPRTTSTSPSTRTTSASTAPSTSRASSTSPTPSISTPLSLTARPAWRSWAVRTLWTSVGRTPSASSPAAPTRPCHCPAARSSSTSTSATPPSPATKVRTWRGWRTPAAS